MDWWLLFILILSLLIFLFFLSVPVAFCFLFVNVLFAYLFWGGEMGLTQLVLSIARSISSFSLLPVPLFLLMGEVMFLFGIAQNMMDTLEKWMGRIPGRLSLLAVVGGVLFATLSGSSMAGCAMLGQTLVPEMEKKGYKYSITLGPIMGCGTLAAMIPPSALGVLLASLAQISVGDFLLSITHDSYLHRNRHADSYHALYFRPEASYQKKGSALKLHGVSKMHGLLSGIKKTPRISRALRCDVSNKKRTV